jgi:hypothetical protein
MGLTEIRTVCNVDTSKPAEDQANLHACFTIDFFCDINADFLQNRWHPESMV